MNNETGTETNESLDTKLYREVLYIDFLDIQYPRYIVMQKHFHAPFRTLLSPLNIS